MVGIYSYTVRKWFKSKYLVSQRISLPQRNKKLFVSTKMHDSYLSITVKIIFINF